MKIDLPLETVGLRFEPLIYRLLVSLSAEIQGTFDKLLGCMKLF